MKVSIVTFEGFNEIDSLVAFNCFNRLQEEGCQALITSNQDSITSMHGLTLETQQYLDDVSASDVVIFGSGINSRQHAEDRDIINSVSLEPDKQLIASQCSGAWFISNLPFIERDHPICTDNTTAPLLRKRGHPIKEFSYAK